MAVPSWSIVFGATTLTNVQSASITIGRQKVTDPFRSGTSSFTGRRPDLLPSIAIGDTFTATLAVGATTATYHYRVADLRIDYGITSAYDTWELVGEDAFAFMGRASVTLNFTAGENTYDAAAALGTAAGVTVNENASYPGISTLKAVSITNGNALDVLNTIANTEQAYLAAGSNEIQFNGRNWQAGMNFYDVTDDGTGTTPVKYDRLVFRGLADNYASRVEVTIRDGSTVSSGTGDYSYAIDTYSQTNADATDVAAFVESQLESNTITPSQVSILLNAQTSNGWVNLGVPQGMKIKFRTNTYKCFVLGQTIVGDVDTTRITYNLAGAEFYQYLVLDDVTFGKLDTNKLGF